VTRPSISTDFLAAAVLKDAHGHREQAEHAESHKRDERGYGVAQVKLILRQADERADGIAETHRQKSQKNREGAYLHRLR
jgi:F0F1-type ATP synthase membrane subunit b/b'